MAAKSTRLQGKVAVVTGGASGIGEETVRSFINQSARAVVIADIQDEKGQQLANSLDPDRCIYIHCDISDEEQVKSLIQTTVNTYGQLDIMFCNAGLFNRTEHFQNILEFDIAEYEKVFSVNVRGTAASVKHAARAMVEKEVKGSIICTSSYAGRAGTPMGTDYSMSKHAVVGLMRCASRQLGAYGIRVNCVSPGGVATPLSQKLFGTGEKELEKKFEESSYLKGTLKATDVADAVVFLASDESRFVTGVDLAVDAGIHL